MPTIAPFLAAFADGSEPSQLAQWMASDKVGFFLAIMVFALGATVGSFLNVCIYRVPRNLSVNEPRRSFCPSCKYAIPWYHNIPLVTWLVLRGKCANCKEKISMRYWWVELLTAVTFLFTWNWFGGVENWALALVYCAFLAMLIVATFVDFEHFIIPDGITKGGVVAGVLASLAVPAMMDTDNRLHALGWSIAGAAAGFGILWLVVVIGKLAFGRKSQSFDKPEPWKITQEEGEDNPTLTVAGEKYPWEDLFFVGSEFVRLEAEAVTLNGEKTEKVPVEVHMEHVMIGQQKTPLEELTTIDGSATRMVYSREAMGFSDVKFLAMIGAFLGWKAILFTVFLASVVGTLVALPLRIIGKHEWSARIPFGPYLALGAVVWLFFGQQILDWYFGLLGR